MEKVKICLRDKEGLHMVMEIPKELANLMGKLRAEDPLKWENNDFELIAEAEKILENK